MAQQAAHLAIRETAGKAPGACSMESQRRIPGVGSENDTLLRDHFLLVAHLHRPGGGGMETMVSSRETRPRVLQLQLGALDLIALPRHKTSDKSKRDSQYKYCPFDF